MGMKLKGCNPATSNATNTPSNTLLLEGELTNFFLFLSSIITSPFGIGFAKHRQHTCLLYVLDKSCEERRRDRGTNPLVQRSGLIAVVGRDQLRGKTRVGRIEKLNLTMF
jgi:hypothetical protein